MSRAHFKFKWLMRGLVFAVGFIAIFSVIVMLLWNWLIPQIFGIGQITYIQAAGLLVLSKILFGFGGRGGHMSHAKKEHLKQRFEENFHEKFEERCREKFGDKRPESGESV